MRACLAKDIVSTAGEEMSTKRKAESHLRVAGRPRIMKSGESRADSERDSGFSGWLLFLPLSFFSLFNEVSGDLRFLSACLDASSEHMSTMDTTDSEDSPRPVVQKGPKTPGTGTQASQLAVVGGSYSNLSPMIIMNNVLLKQVQTYSPQACPSPSLFCIY